MTKHLVLIGAGHGHIEVIRRAQAFTKAGIELTLIDRGGFEYSGSMTAVLSDAIDHNQARLDRYKTSKHVNHVRTRATRIHPSARQVVTDDGRILDFDVLSVNTGSYVHEPALVAAGAIPAKPICRINDLKSEIKAAGGRMRLVVAGAGATGVEIAASLAALQTGLGVQPDVLLVGPELMDGWPASASGVALKALSRSGVQYRRAHVCDYKSGTVQLDDGAVGADVLVVATGLHASLPEGLPKNVQGLPVGPDLSWIENEAIFAVGDCAHMVHAPRPKLGVFGVRAAPVLIHNLLCATGVLKTRKRYKPQSHWLSIMDMGDGSGLGRYGRFVFYGRRALSLKRWLDHRFMDRYRAG